MTFTEFVQSLGLIVSHCPADGVWHRVKTQSHPHKRNGAFKLFPDGRIGYAQDHAAHPEPLKWKAGADAELPKVDKAAIARRQESYRASAAKSSREMAQYWAGCKPLRVGHPYLDSHGLDMAGCDGLRVAGDGWMVAPAINDGMLCSVQRISPDGIKRFWPGCSMSGASYVIDRRDATLTVICEGLATGLALFAACKSARVIVAFDAGNMAKLQFPVLGLATVAADNDLATFERLGRNPGLDAARAFSERTGAGIAAPDGIVGTDWCDFRQEKRAEAMARRGRFQSEGQVLKVVDEVIAREITRSAKFITARAGRADN
jgi:putative DNA primase/helicase